MVDIQGDTLIPFRQFHSVLDHSQSPKPQEIHLQKPQFFQSGHGKLGDNRPVRSPGKRHILIYCLLADDNSRRMHGSMSGKALQPLAHIN